MEKRLQQLFKKSFDVDRIDDRMSADDVEGWDSMGHVGLMMALEREFGISISPTDIVSLNNIGKIKNFLREQGVD